jgi:amino acid permease
MYKEVLRSMEGVEIGAIFSFSIFFVFFLIMIVYLIRLKKDYRDEMKNIPLD